MRLGSWAIRVSMAGVLAIAILYAVAPYAFGYISNSAVVNAPVLSIKAPFDGVVVTASAPVSTYLAPGDTAVELRSKRQSRSEMEALRAEHAALDGEFDALDTQVARLRKLSSALEERFEQHSELARQRHVALRHEQLAALEQAEVELRLALEELDRTRRLHGSGAVSDAVLEALEGRRDRALGDVARQQAQIEVIDIELAGLDQAVFPEWSAASDIRRRIDEIEIRMTELQAQRTGLSHRRAALGSRIVSLDNELKALDLFAPTVPVGGVVWEATGAEGTAVAQGDEVMRILDCGTRLVEVAVSERHFETIRPGDAAWVQLKGSGDQLEGRVEAVRGRGGRLDRRGLAVEPAELEAEQLGILVRLGPGIDSDPSAEGAAFCDVGRTAQVRFGSRGPTLAGLRDRAAQTLALVVGWGLGRPDGVAVLASSS